MINGKSGYRIILASGSPRRRELLEKHGVNFEVVVTEADEDADMSLPPSEIAVTVARRKGEAAVNMLGGDEETVIIAADTIVYINGRVLGKPKDKQDAVSMLKMLSGNWHSVFTGMSIAFTGDGETVYIEDCCETKVKFKPLTASQIESYIDSNKPYDKAGSYAIQDTEDCVVERIEGDYENVVGLSVGRLFEIISQNIKE